MTKSKVNKIEGFEKRASKMVIELNVLIEEYEERLKVLGLKNLETMRIRGDLLLNI